jgi:hypothetical protein
MIAPRLSIARWTGASLRRERWGVCTKNSVRIGLVTEPPTVSDMVALLCFLLMLFASPLKSKCRLEAENAALRYQLAMLRRKVRKR